MIVTGTISPVPTMQQVQQRTQKQQYKRKDTQQMRRVLRNQEKSNYGHETKQHHAGP